VQKKSPETIAIIWVAVLTRSPAFNACRL